MKRSNKHLPRLRHCPACLCLLGLLFTACGNPSSGEKVQNGFYQPVQRTETKASDTEKFDGDAPLETPRMEVKASEILIQHEGFAISYNQSRCIPNWVAYELTKSETRGDVERTDYFDVDPLVTGRQAKFGDYSHTGYDRGHMAPAGDMKWNKQAMDACFYLTNICPQDHNLNKGDWNDLEIKCREWARRYGKAWIVTGPIITSKEPKTIGRNHVVVPDAFFKAVMVKNDGKYESVAFIMDNAPGNGTINDDMHTIDDLENLTGIDFFWVLPDKIENKTESTYDPVIWR